MKWHSHREQDSRFLQSAFSLAKRINSNGPKRAVFPLTRQWCTYFYFCARAIQPGFLLLRLIWATLRLCPHIELRLIKLRHQVCIQALADDPDLEQLIRVIQVEQDVWGRALLGKNWSIPAMTAIQSATQIGIRWRDAVWAFRFGQVRQKNGVLVAVTVYPLAAGIFISIVTIAWFGAIAFNMYVIRPKALGDSLLVLGYGIVCATWLGHVVHAAMRAKRDLLSRLVEAHRPRVIS